ncbi:MAG: hypothetical protein ACOCVH_00530 [Verrucomicrobiota bacterium]
MKNCLIICTSFFALVASVYADLSVNMTVREPAGVTRVAEPVCGGIPLPRRTYKADQPFAVFSGDREVPSQVLPMVVDEDGFVSWALVDLQADVPAKGASKFVLKAVKSSAKPGNELRIRESGKGVMVDTGKIQFSILKTRPFSLFSEVRVDGKSVVRGGEVTYTDPWGDKNTYTADKPASVEVEYAGPMRTTICVKGRFQGDDENKFQYIARITAWAGKSRVGIKYKLANSNPDHYCYRQVKDSSISLALAEKPAGTVLGASTPLTAGPEASLTAGLRAKAEGAARATDAAREVWSSNGKGDKAEGWIAARLGNASIYACDTYFTDDPPRKLEVKNGALVLTGTTRRFDSDKRGARPFKAEHRVLFDCSHLRSEYLIDFDAPKEEVRLEDMAGGARGWLHLTAEPSWYSSVDSLGVGRFGVRDDELKCYELWGWSYNENKAPKSPGKIGTRRFVLYEDNHFETEQDSVEAYLLMYLRTGSRSYLQGGQGWANYEMDRQKWRTDGWRWKDGGVWKRSGPLGNRPQRGKDPVTGKRNYCPGKKCSVLEPGASDDMYKMSIGSQCRCHNYAAGLAVWYCITGDRDALEAAIDSVEQMVDYQKRVKKLAPGKEKDFSRDFTRSVYLVNATRLAAPTDAFVCEASDYLTGVFLGRGRKEPRGLVNGARPLKMKGWGKFAGLKKYVGEKGLAEMEKLGITFSKENGELHDPETGVKWFPIPGANSFMLPPVAGGIHAYYRITGDEDAQDWVIAFGKALKHVLQQDHGQLHGSLLVDFPKKGIVKDRASWDLPPDSVNGEGVKISGYLARFYPDVPARAYELCGDPVLKEAAYEYWNHGSHRGYWAKRTKGLGERVGRWVNIVGPHSETVCFTAHTFWIHAHPRKDTKAPVHVKDLNVTLNGNKATVSFTTPSDQGGGRVVRYQLKCSERPIVSYEKYLKLYNNGRDEEKSTCNWWMAVNADGEPRPGKPGSKEIFTISNVPENTKYFALCSFDDSHNRSEHSNVFEVK